MVQGLSKLEAFRSAGYTGTDASGPATLYKRPGVQERIDFLRSQTAERAVIAAAVTRGEIIEGLRDNVKQAKEGTPLLGRDGTPTDISKPDLASANRGYEILAKMHGFMLDVTRDDSFNDSLNQMEQPEAEALVLSLIEQLDPNARKMMLEGLEKKKADTTEEGDTLQ